MCVIYSHSTCAQNYPYIAPNVPVPETTGAIVPPQQAIEVANDKVIVQSLRGIRLVDDINKIHSADELTEGMSEDGPQLFVSDPAIELQLKTFLGNPLTFSKMQDVSKIIVDWYRAHNHPLVDVIFPEQDMDSGVLQVLVMQFHIGAITISGNEWFSDDQVLAGLRVKSGDTPDFEVLNEDLSWMNQNPFRSVNAVFKKADESGATDLAFEAEDRFPVRVYAGYDNTGVPDLGRSRYNLGANWGNAFWSNQLLSYQFTSSSNFWVSDGSLLGNPEAASFLSHSIDDVIPLPWHDKIEIFGSYAREKPQIGTEFNQVGHSGQAGLRYIHMLPALSWLEHEVQLGYDYKTADNNLEFGGTQIYTSSTEVDQFVIVYKGSEKDSYGQATFRNSLICSPGGLTNANSTTTFQQSGASFARADYVYDNVELTRIQPLSSFVSSVTRFNAQISTGNLLPSEEVSAGGSNSVRGYDEETAIGSQGILFSEEIRSPSFNMSQFLFGENIGDQTQFLGFWDFGSVGDNKTQPNQPSSTQLSSVGLGMRYSIGSNFNLNADYGWQLIAAPNQRIGSRAHIALTASY